MKVDESSSYDFDCGYSEYAKENHKKRVLKNGDRIQFAIEQFKKNDIKYLLKNEQTGHFHCWRKSDNKLYQFWAGTGKIMNESKYGIQALIKILKGE